ncbi:MAG: hypothetical protein AABZ25_07540 [Nitrospirota bacterium]
MKATLIQKGHSHASCVQAITLASKSLLNKIPTDPEEKKKLKLSEDELKLLKEVILKFGEQERKKA